MKKRKNQGWLITGLVLAVTAIVSIKYQDKIKEWTKDVPVVKDMLN